MRLGGPLFENASDPEQWIEALQRQGYTAAYCPELNAEDDAVLQAYVRAAHEANIVIGEVGAWSNPISPDDEIRRKAVAYCKQRLALADQVGARCCVNIAGSRSSYWAGPHPDNLSADTFALIVDTVREIIDSVKPTKSFYALETMQWVFPDTVDNYVRLVHAIDRPQFAVHLDPVNLISSPQLYFNNAALIKECFDKLGPYIKSCHAKDLLLDETLTVIHLDETVPGKGALHYPTFLRELSKLDPDIPLMLEHLSTSEEYQAAAAHIRSTARSLELQV
ncbi:sugar phosphate isomerase/epimerase family protein [Paenibacillus mendelii]|uniref:Sugar phosphate isomerase/epimerase family protein n=1 Tax=Paenibacillus mendelii TaxID=206163 RepID=A0ABV6J6P6_9BACL|nr:TIM barrel protein [Paenibacillus mendelii]MCQ6561072.1 sugar phosphate isomerase/epimerase [Paenibacillus mendelii]